VCPTGLDEKIKIVRPIVNDLVIKSPVSEAGDD